MIRIFYIGTPYPRLEAKLSSPTPLDIRPHHVSIYII